MDELADKYQISAYALPYNAAKREAHGEFLEECSKLARILTSFYIMQDRIFRSGKP